MQPPSLTPPYSNAATRLPEVPSTVESGNLAQLKLLLEEDAKGIIADPKLFWALFCTAFANNKESIEAVEVWPKPAKVWAEVNGENIDLISEDPELVTQIRVVIEELRTYFHMAGSEERDFAISVFNIDKNDFIYRFAGEEEDLNELYLSKTSIKQQYFIKLVEPCLQEMAKRLGVHVETRQAVQRNLHFIAARQRYHNLRSTPYYDTVREVLLLRFTWNRNMHYVYPIPPLTLHVPCNVETTLHDMMKTGLMCDWKFIAQGKQLPIHANIAFARGGEALKSMLLTTMQEGILRETHFPEYDIGTLNAVVDYLYLGGKEFMARFKKPEQNYMSDLSELLDFAQAYEIPGFVNCCTNLISLFAKPSDIESLAFLADKYHNGHLKLLCAHFSEEKKKLLIKP